VRRCGRGEQHHDADDERGQRQEPTSHVASCTRRVAGRLSSHTTANPTKSSTC
jgi:hypothetical protein